ncbi:MAG: alpha/beta hydrolase [Pseudomonadota bacterium]
MKQLHIFSSSSWLVLNSAGLFFSFFSILGNAEPFVSREKTQIISQATHEYREDLKEFHRLRIPPRFKETNRYLLLPPVQSSPNAMILMILPGAKKQAWEYSHLAEEIQKKSFVPLWIGIAEFTGNLPNPLEANFRLRSLIEYLKKEGLSTAGEDKIFLAGHSMGGIMAQGQVKNKKYAGLILFSSYLTRKNDMSTLPDFPMPVLTMSGELDGLTRITRISLENEAAQEVAQKVGEKVVAARKPVILVKGVNHSQFASEVLIDGDFLPEVTYPVAQEKIAQVTADFIMANSKSEIAQDGDTNQHEDAILRLMSGQKETSALLQPFVASKKDQSQWCAGTQILLVDHLKANQKITVLNDVYPEKKLFSQSVPKAEVKSDTSLEVHVPTWEEKPSNPFDFSIIPEGTSEIDCKLYVPNSVPNVETKSVSCFEHSLESAPIASICQYANLRIYEEVLSKMSEVQRLRFQSRGKKLAMDADFLLDSERSWLNSPLKISPSESDRETLIFQSPAWISSIQTANPNINFLEGDSQYNCKLLSPSRIAEWILVDSFKK